MLLSPYLDYTFKPSLHLAKSLKKKTNIFFILFSIGVSFFGFISNALSLELIIFTLIISSIPEEWFFRAYFQPKTIQYFKLFFNENISNIIGIILTSILFSSIHAISQNNISLIYLIFIPSIFYGYIFLKTKDIILVINLHFISNTMLYTLQSYLA